VKGDLELKIIKLNKIMKSLIIKNKLLLVLMAVFVSFGFFAVNVFADAPTLNSISVDTSNAKTTYTVGEALDITGLVVTGEYVSSNGEGGFFNSTSTISITESNVSVPDMSTTTTGQILIITIDGKTTTYTIDVIPAVYTLTYSAGSNGTLTGSTTQAVDQNTDGTSVTAVANSGFHFVDWSDASTANPRTDTNVQGNITVTANFAADAVVSSGGGSRSGGSRVINTTNTTPTVTAPTNEGQVLGAATFAFNNDLRLGMTGQEVVELQERLRAEGFFTFQTSTGYFGPITLAAVKAYQTAHPEIGYVTGFVGPLTRAVLNQ
jgi:hypothetical protein